MRISAQVTVPYHGIKDMPLPACVKWSIGFRRINALQWQKDKGCLTVSLSDLCTPFKQKDHLGIGYSKGI